MRKLYLVGQKFIKTLMRTIWNYEVINQEGLIKAQSCIIASNHITWFDPPFIGSVTPFEIAYLAKSELFKFSPFGNLLRSLNAIPVKRNQADLRAITDVLNVLQSGKSLLLFPEGGTNGKQVKPGVGLFAIRMKKDIVPVYIKNVEKPFSCLFRIRKTQIIVGEPIKYESFEDMSPIKENYQELANQVYEKIQGLGK